MNELRLEMEKPCTTLEMLEYTGKLDSPAPEDLAYMGLGVLADQFLAGSPNQGCPWELCGVDRGTF